MFLVFELVLVLSTIVSTLVAMCFTRVRM